MLRRVFGVGIFESGKYNATLENKPTWQYRIWQNMMKRCYSAAEQERRPAYKGCSVSEEFHYFQEFMSWAEVQAGFGKNTFELDKDILFKGNKVYSSRNCVFVPHEINTLLIRPSKGISAEFVGVSYEKWSSKFKAQMAVNGKCTNLGRYKTQEEAFYVYKEAKENRVKEMANKWKSQIDPRAYEALMNYEVLITD